jgi:hypothetical protein
VRTALTSRNELLWLRRVLAVRWPDLVKSNAGGANVILARRASARITDHRRMRLRRWPERRVCHGVALDSGLWCANLHAQVDSPARARADIARAAEATLAWARGGAALLGGDFNVTDPAAPGFERLGGHGVDHVLGHLVAADGPAQVLDRGPLSDHPPIVVGVLPLDVGSAG